MFSVLFATANPFLARLYDFWCQGLVNLMSYSFQAEWNPITASAVAALPTTQMVIDAETDFLLLAMNFVAYPTTGDQTTPQANPNMLLGITEKSGSTVLSDSDHHVALWTGRGSGGGNSYVLPFPRRVIGSNTIKTVLTDNGGTATHCWLGWEGVKIEYNTDRASIWEN